jgi:hypothetical protein
MGSRTNRQMRIVMNHLAKQMLTVFGILSGIKDMLMPEVIKILGPRHHHSCLSTQQVEKFAIVFLNDIDVVLKLPPPAFAAEEFGFNFGQVKFVNFRF